MTVFVITVKKKQGVHEKEFKTHFCVEVFLTRSEGYLPLMLETSL